MEPVNSIIRAIKIMEMLKQEGSLNFTDLFKRFDLPKSSLHKILSTLNQEGLITRDPDNNKYYLGVKLIELGSGARSNLEIRKVATPFMKQLHEQLDYLTIHLVVMSEGEIMPIECHESESWYRYQFIYSTAIGVKAPMHCTGSGKVLLAFMERQQVDEILKVKGLKKFTKNTITNKKALFKELKAIAQRGYGVGNAEHEDQIRTVAAPIFDHEGKILATLSALGLTSRITMGDIPGIAKLVVANAQEISRQMGYNP